MSAAPPSRAPAAGGKKVWTPALVGQLVWRLLNRRTQVLTFIHMNNVNGQRNGNNSGSFRHREVRPSQPLNHAFGGLQGGGQRQVKVAAVQERPQAPVSRRPEVKIKLASVHSEFLKIAQVLCVRHYRGDVSVLDVFYPLADTRLLDTWGKSVAIADEIALTGEALRQAGDHYLVVQVMKSPSGACFQLFHPEANGELVPMSKVIRDFPDIKWGPKIALAKLTDITGLRFEPNLQIRWKEYVRLPSTQADAEHNPDANLLTEYNKREAAAFKQAMEQFADVAVGTPLKVARIVVAARMASAASGGLDVDITEPTFGFQNQDVEVVEPAQPWAAQTAVNA